MRTRKELHGIAVMDVSGGKKLGSVDDLVVAAENGRVLALTLSSGILGSGTYVPIEDVRSIGPDAVTVDGENVVRRDAEMPEEVGAARESSSALVGKKVVTEAGSLLGTIGDYFIDESARRVTGLVVGGGLLSAQDGLSADRILSVGPDAVIVTDEGTEASGAGQPRSPWAGD